MFFMTLGTNFFALINVLIAKDLIIYITTKGLVLDFDSTWW